MNHSAADIRLQAERLLHSAGVSREPVSLRDVVSALNLELVQKTREPFACEAALEPLGDGHAIVLRGGVRRAPPPVHDRPRDRALRAAPAAAQPGARRQPSTRRVRGRSARPISSPPSSSCPSRWCARPSCEHGGDVERLADRFDVSRPAMQMRLRRLGLGGHHNDSRSPRRG